MMIHIGDFLISKGLLSTDQLRIALIEQTRGVTRMPLGHLLVSLGFISESILREALSESLGRESVDLSCVIADPAALAQIPREVALQYNILPIGHRGDDPTEGHCITLAMSNPDDLVTLDQLRTRIPVGWTLETRLAGESEIAHAIDQYYGHELSIEGILNEIENGHEEGQPVIRLVDAFLTNAVKSRASDIHFEPEAGFLRIRYRIDGRLRQIRALHKSHWLAMVVRLKVMSGMNIAETRAPQDGRMTLSVSGRLSDFRVSAQPTIHGENIVARILDRQKGIMPLDTIGLDASQLSTLRQMMTRPEGILLVTGPTGSGKTTTLYSMLSHINAEGINIMTLEDPVEYPMALIRQTSLAEAVKLDFAGGIRSMMRQDPDVILVGEIRDAETARMAFRAAMTGHQVYSTLHTNSAIGAFPRLMDIGISPEIMAGNIVGIIAQRLVRKLCPSCRISYAADPEEAALLRCESSPTLYRAAGCEQCDFQGYRHRVALMELLRMDANMDDLIARRATHREIRQQALTQGYRPLSESGIACVLEGTTSLEEVSRMIDLTVNL